MSATAAPLETAVRLPPWAALLRDEPHRYKVLYGGRGGGRSWQIARTLLITALERELRILCCREIQASIRASVHTLLKQQIEMLGFNPPGFDPLYEVTDTEIRAVNGSVFFFEGLHRNITKIKSYEGVDIAWVEEAEHVTEESWKVLTPTIRKPGSEIWVNFNPDLETDPTYRRFVLNPPPDSLILFVTSENNKHFPDELRREREYAYATDPESAAHVWGGETRAVSQLSILAGKWRVEDFEPGEDWDGPYHGADFGYSVHPTTLVRCWMHDERLYVEYESYEITLEMDETPARWAKDVPGSADYVIRGDKARPEVIGYLKRNGLPKSDAADKWKGSVLDGIAHLRQFREIIVHSRCKHTADERRHYRWKTNTAGDPLPEPADGNDHMIDAIRYALDPFIRRSTQRTVRAYSAAAS